MSMEGGTATRSINIPYEEAKHGIMNMGRVNRIPIILVILL